MDAFTIKAQETSNVQKKLSGPIDTKEILNLLECCNIAC